MSGKRPRSPWTVNPRVSCEVPRYLDRLKTVALTSAAYGDFDRPSWPVSERIRRDAREFAVNYLFDEVLSKFDDNKSSSERREVALRKFAEAELACSNTNLRLGRVSSQGSVDPRSVRSLLEGSARKVNHILGPLDWDEVSEGFGFGPGATTRLSRVQADAAYKYSGIPESTLDNLTAAQCAIQANSIWFEHTDEIRIVGGSKITTVPKNSKTDRVICIEPDMNIYIQKGLGRVIRNRLMRWGIDLNDQSINQEMARLASIRGFLATIDLSAASDTISYELVRLLLPPDWFAALELCRSPEGVLPCGDKVTFHKFSSMGNGYTFELESLLFFAMCLAVCDAFDPGAEKYVSVYGDDIIIPCSVAPHLVDFFSECGFTVNQKKSFVEGPFRESCGKHYFLGVDVSPFYVRRPVDTLDQLMLFHNNIYRWLKRTTGLTSEALRLLESIRSNAPSAWRKPRIPDGIGDGAFVGTFDQCTPRASRQQYLSGWQGFSAVVLQEKTRARPGPEYGRLISSLLKVGSSDPWDSLSNTGQSYWTTCRTLIFEWSDF